VLKYCKEKKEKSCYRMFNCTFFRHTYTRWILYTEIWIHRIALSKR